MTQKQHKGKVDKAHFFISCINCGLKHPISFHNKEVIKKIKEKFYGVGGYMDTQDNKGDCRNCYINGFTDCFKQIFGE